MQRRLFAGRIVLALLCLPLFAAQIPRPAPPLTFTLPSGKQVKLSKYKGKVVALEFLLTTCPHCKRASRVIKKLYTEYGPKGFQALGVAINDGAERLIPAYRLELDLNYPVGYIKRDLAVDFLQHPIMRTMYVPQLVFIDKTGTIVAQYSGTNDFFRNEEVNIRKKIEELLAK